MEKKIEKKCKDCGRYIPEDEHDAFHGRCVDCDEIYNEMVDHKEIASHKKCVNQQHPASQLIDENQGNAASQDRYVNHRYFASQKNYENHPNFASKKNCETQPVSANPFFYGNRNQQI